MAQRNRYNHKRQQKRPSGPRASAPREAPVRHERKPPTEYGEPFVLLEDHDKNTFEYTRGNWVPYALSIAQCRQECQVKELPQKVREMTRYEIRLPLPLAT